MSLSPQDLLAIRSIVREEIKPIEGRLKAVENDVKEIYFMISSLQKAVT